MNKLMQGVERFWKDEEGAETVEWVLVAALMVAAFVAGYAMLGEEIADVFTSIGEALGTASDGIGSVSVPGGGGAD
ncbi:Flp family type IVb pilin [Billgrantia sp. Q4P2]|uniref:Flp family type IVb pilin n=1 Tax=Billgrantia sp. Q4P2 TaxID=3463857 RepID=UPI004056AC3D